ncbi:hypothetical protein EGJ34_12925 [Stenotrophomonas sp. 278]|nr:hypothetical protein EGJ34_12925 [Stenotrophomonas sp. 278]
MTMQTHWPDTAANDDITPARTDAAGAADGTVSSPGEHTGYVEILLMRIGLHRSDAPCASA